MKSFLKEAYHRWHAPTPAFFRQVQKFGAAVTALSLTLAVASNVPIIARITTILTTVGAVLTGLSQFAVDWAALREDPKPKSPNIVGLVLLIGCAWMLLASGCVTAKQRAERDRRAVNAAVSKATTDSAGLQKVREIVTRLFPCIPAKGIEGKPVITTVTITDSNAVLKYKAIVDSLLSSKPVQVAALSDSLKAKIRTELLNAFIPPTRTHTDYRRVDTVPDLRALQLKDEQIAELNKSNAVLVARNADKDTKIDALERLAAKRLYSIWIIVGCLALGIVARSFFKLPIR